MFKVETRTCRLRPLRSCAAFLCSTFLLVQTGCGGGFILLGLLVHDSGGGGGGDRPPAAPVIVSFERVDAEHVVVEYSLLDDDGGLLDVVVDWQAVDGLGAETAEVMPFRKATDLAGRITVEEDTDVQSDGTTGLSVEPNTARRFRFIWNARGDLRRSPLGASGSLVRMRLAAVEEGVAGEYSVTIPFYAGNDRPEVKALDVLGSSGNVPLSVRTADSSSDPVRLALSYRIGLDGEEEPATLVGITPDSPFETRPGTGGYHIGLDVNASTRSAQRNHEVGVHDDDLPDIYHPTGIHGRILYDHGLVRAWVRSNAGTADDGDAGRTWLKVIDYEIEPVELTAAQAVVGFTAATGGATCIMEVDNLVIQKLGGMSRFVRGDPDSTGVVNLADGISILSFLFGAGTPPKCLDSADTDDSGAVNIADAIGIFSWLFVGGTPPAPPGPSATEYLAPDCGLDPTDDPLDCSEAAAVCQ